MRTGNSMSMRAALTLGLAAIEITGTEDADVYFEPAGRGAFIMRDHPPARSRTGSIGKGKRRAKNKAARKMRKQQRRQ